MKARSLNEDEELIEAIEAAKKRNDELRAEHDAFEK
jgi:hypothetical protein